MSSSLSSPPAKRPATAEPSIAARDSWDYASAYIPGADAVHKPLGIITRDIRAARGGEDHSLSAFVMNGKSVISSH